jgi:PKD repeat protein
MRTPLALIAALTAAFAVVAGCTVHQTEAPALAGPSELSTSVLVTATPDTINRDGASQASIQVLVRDANARPIAGVPLRLDMLVSGSLQDFGTLSARNLVTGSDGKAIAVYTAPAAAPAGANGNATVTISVTPTNGNFQTAQPQTVDIRLVPTGVILPGVSFVPKFTTTPSSPTQGQPVLFDATSSTDPNGQIVSYSWNFGDGATGSGRTASHAYTSARSYFVTLTVADAYGRAASATGTLTVGSATLTADFVVSPDEAVADQPVTFDATISKASGNGEIEEYRWSFGDSTGVIVTSSPIIQHTYTLTSDGTYTVTLTIEDSFGNTATKTKTLDVTGVAHPPGARFTVTPAFPGVGEWVTFDSSSSEPGATGGTTPVPAVIVDRSWDFGDGTAAYGTPAAVPHQFTRAGTFTVTLTITNSLGNQASVTKTVTVH